MGPDETLYGLYEGVPGVVYGADWTVLPNKISLFRLPLEQDFPDPAELAREVRRTVVHELAHHAGIDDALLERYGLD
jgi:predicted Zn-dependent protease with MMP-like domain